MKMDKNLDRFLQIACCRKCNGKLVKIKNGLQCHSCAETFFYNSDNILLCYPRTQAEKSTDKYEDEKFVDKYAGIFAYGDKVLARGEMESLHRTVSELILSHSIKRHPRYILDVGCGVGRTTFNCANYLPDTLTVGIDLSEKMLKMAKNILMEKQIVELDLTHYGFGRKQIKGFGLENIFLLQGNADSLPFGELIFDIVVNVNLLDRVVEPSFTLKSIISVLKPGGKLIFTSPLNWMNSQDWDKYSNKENIQELFESHGLLIDELFDGLIYREAADARSYSDWNTLVISATKK
jgi:ubiquinone/menaquinone biosynthesis C-methylase UbiE